MPLAPPVELLRQLVAARSISSVSPEFDSSNLAVIDLLANWLDELGFAVRVQPLPEDPQGTGPAKANLVAQLGTGEDGLVLSGHTDTVPCDPEKWTSDPFRLRQQDALLYGLGSADMKGYFAAALTAAASLDARRLRRPLILIATADEESTMQGARALAEFGPIPGARAVIGEPTLLTPIRLHKGITMQQLRIIGRAGHSSVPHLGRNALEGMNVAMNLLLAWRGEIQQRFHHAGFDVPVPTLNLGHIHGGDNPNRICGECVLHFDLRSLPSMVWAQLREELIALLETGLAGRELEWSLDCLDVEVPAFETAADAPLVRLAEQLSGRPARSVAFASEAPFLQQLGMETIIMGPGDINVAHAPDEHLSIQQLDEAVDLLGRLIEESCVRV